MVNSGTRLFENISHLVSVAAGPNIKLTNGSSGVCLRKEVSETIRPASSRQSGGQLDAVDPQHRLRLDDDLLALEPVSLPELHVDFGPGLGLFNDSGLDPHQLLTQQRPTDQGELLRANQQHLFHPDPLPALRFDVILDQDQVFVGDLPLVAGEVHHGK